MSDVPVRVTGLDHVVINSADVEASLAFYVDTLGLAPERVEEWRRGEIFFPSVRIDDHTIIDLMPTPPTGMNVDHLCLVIEPTDMDALVASARFEVRTGPVTRWGARGDATSIYLTDPDGNGIELRCYDDDRRQ